MSKFFQNLKKYWKVELYIIFLIVVVFFVMFWIVPWNADKTHQEYIGKDVKFPIYILWYTGGYKISQKEGDMDRAFGASYRLASKYDYIQFINGEMEVPDINLDNPNYFNNNGNPSIWYVEREEVLYLSSISGYDSMSSDRLRPINKDVISKIQSGEVEVKKFDWVGKTIPIQNNPVMDILFGKSRITGIDGKMR